MSLKSHNIPIKTKESIEIQTDVNLINELTFDYCTSQQHLKMSDKILKNKILSPFSDSLYKDLAIMIQELKEAPQGSQKDFSKRLSMLEKQIDGLAKRDILLNEKSDIDGQFDKSFYHILDQKEKQMFKMEYKMAYNDSKMRSFQQKNDELSQEIVTFQNSLRHTKNILVQNEKLRKVIESLKDGESKLSKIERELKLERVDQKKVDKQASLISKQFSKQLERLSSEQNMSNERLTEQILSMISISNIPSAEQISENFAFKSKYFELTEKYSNVLHLCKLELGKIQKSNASIKGLDKISQLIKLSKEHSEVQFVNIQGWVGIGTISHRTVTNTSSSEVESNMKVLLKLAMKSLQTISEKYPKVNSQLSEEVRAFLNKKEFMEDMIESDALARLRQLVVYQQETVRVDNVYSYNDSKEKEKNFHLRVLVKSLLEEIEKIKGLHQIDIDFDEGLLELLRKEMIETIDVDSVLKLYRPLPKIVEVQRIIEKPVYINGTLEKGVPIKMDRAIIAECLTEKAVEIIKQVPVYIDRVVDNAIKQLVEVNIQTEKVVEVPTIRDVIVQKLVISEKLNEVEVEKLVPLYKERILEATIDREVVVEIPKIIEIEKIVEAPGQKEYVEIQKQVEKAVYLKEYKEKIKEVEVINQKVFEKEKYVQVEKKIPYVVTNREVVYLQKEVPKFITNTEEKQVIITEIVEKIVPYKVIEENVIEVPVIQEKQIIRQIQKQLLVEVTHFIKGDREEVIKEVEVIVEKPIREEVLITKDLEIERIAPLYIKQQKPYYIELQTPYIQTEPHIINNDVTKVVTVKEEMIKEVRVEVPVPVIVQKEIVKVETVFVDRIVEKIVEVPRVVEIEKIVEKIVPIPRIIEKIVEVLRVVEKIVTVEVPCLQIVEVIREVPVIKEVEVIKQIEVIKPLIEIHKEFQVVEKEIAVEVVVEKQVIKEVEVERRIPVELLRQVPVEIFRDRIVEKLVEIHDVNVKDRQVVVPYIQETPVEFIVQKPVVTEKIVERIVNVPQVVEREIPITNTVTIPQIVEIIFQKAVEHEVIKEVPGIETIKYIEIPKQIELLKEKVVLVDNTVEVPKEIYLYMDKIVHEYHEKFLPIQVPKIVEKPHIIEISKPQHFIHYKQIPIQVDVHRNIPVRTFIDEIKEVDKQVTVVQQVQIVQEKIKEIVRENTKFIEKEVEKEFLREVMINQTKIQTIEVPADSTIIETNKTTVEVQPQQNFIEKVVERIVMLPQIVEVVKHLHEITEVQSLGVAVDSDLETHTRQYSSISGEMRESMANLLGKLKVQAARQPDLKPFIQIVESHLDQVEKWIKFPKIIEIPKEVERFVEKERVVIVPSSDSSRQASLSYLVEKMVEELKRVKERHRIELKLQDDILKLLFDQKREMSCISEKKLGEFEIALREKYEKMGEWKESYPFMVNSFLQNYFSLNASLEEAHSTCISKEEEISIMKKQIEGKSQENIMLSSYNSQSLRSLEEILRILRDRQNEGLNSPDIGQLIENYSLTLRDLENLRKIKGVYPSEGVKMEQSSLKVDHNFSQLISKISSLESHNGDLNRNNQGLNFKINQLQSKISLLKKGNGDLSSVSVANKNLERKELQDLRSKMKRQSQNQIKSLKQSFERQMQRKNDELERMRTSSDRKVYSNSEIQNENKRIVEEMKSLKRDVESRQREIETSKRDHTREIEVLRRQNEDLKRQQQTDRHIRSSNHQEVDSIKKRIGEDYERKIQTIKDAHNREIQSLRQNNQEIDHVNSSIKESSNTEIVLMRERIKKLEEDLETSRRETQLYQKSHLGKTAYTSSAFTSGLKPNTSEILEKFEGSRSNVKKETYQSTFEKNYESVDSDDKQEMYSNRKSSQKQSDGSSSLRTYKYQMTLKEFIDMKDNQDKGSLSTNIMIKIIDKIQAEAKQGILHSFSPTNIILSNLNSRNFESLQVRFGAPITNKQNRNDALYLAPEILGGGETTEKSIVFTLAVIWDEIIHGSMFFKSMSEINNDSHEFKIRDSSLNPILKNTLFEMMNKKSFKRLQLHETKRRLSLQKYIASK